MGTQHQFSRIYLGHNGDWNLERIDECSSSFKKQEDTTAKVQCIKNETHLSIFISDLILEHLSNHSQNLPTGRICKPTLDIYLQVPLNILVT